MLNEMMRNGSGYVDMTAYNGMTNANPGEIRTQVGKDDEIFLLIAINGKVCTALKLTARDSDGTIPVSCHGQMYTHPGMLRFIFANQLDGYVKTMPKKEFEDVRKAVADVLGFAVTDKATEDLRSESVKLKEDYDKACENNIYLHDELDIANVKNEVLKEELDSYKLYKAMYHELLDKLIAAKAGAEI